MDNDDYTPTTEEIRDVLDNAVPDGGAAFDRWLAARDSDVREQTLAALTRGWNPIADGSFRIGDYSGN